MKHFNKSMLVCLGILLTAGLALADNVTFKVDMGVVQELGLFIPATQTVHVRGSFNGWGDGSQLSDGDGDLVYEGTFDVGTTSPIAYKFVVKTGDAVTWEDNIDNRQLPLTGSDQTLDVVEWCNGIRFKVDMTAPLSTGLFNPATQFVAVMGSFNGWAAGDSVVARRNQLFLGADNVYEANLPVSATAGLEFKFTIQNNSDGKVATWEGHGNRTLTTSDMTLAKPSNVLIPWDSDPGTPVTSTILFQVNISPLRDSGIFNESEGDTLQVRGEFNSWTDANPENSIMRQSFLDPNLYELPVTLTRVPGTKSEYKFYVKFNFARSPWAGITSPSPDWGYEEPGSTGGGNRVLEFPNAPQFALPPVPYKDVYDYIPEGVQVTYNFAADMRCYLRDPANDANIQTDTLRLHVQDIVWHIFNDTREYQEAANMHGNTPFNFTDGDGDSVYTLALATTGVNQNWVQYKLRWEGTEETGPSFVFGRRRVRYVRPDAQGDYASFYQMGVDYFSTTNDPLPIETQDSGVVNDEPTCTVLTSVEQTDGDVPKDYSLGQNYPNPFNPSTTFEYTIRKAGMVKIELFNVMGQKVADLVNEFQQPGSYKVNFEMNEVGDGLTSGVYFYQMTAGDFMGTRRMMFLK